MNKTYISFVAGLFALALFTLPGVAAAADSWGLPGEEEVRFDAKVTDVLCVLSGDCPPDCGAGKRVLGLLKADGELVLPVKNGGPFTGAVADLLPYCGTTVTADGLFTINYGVKTFAMQFVKPQEAKWRRANQFVKDWFEVCGDCDAEWLLVLVAGSVEPFCRSVLGDNQADQQSDECNRALSHQVSICLM